MRPTLFSDREANPVPGAVAVGVCP